MAHQLDISCFRFTVETTDCIPEILGNWLFNLERASFSKKYLSCPSTYDDFQDKYSGKLMTMVLVYYGSELIGERLFEKVTNVYYHSLIMAVEDRYRGMGIAGMICRVAVLFLKWYGIKYISSWTHYKISAENILAKYAPLVSTKPILTRNERELLRQLEQYRALPKNYYGNQRLVKDYYEMASSEKGHARFWIHEVINK